MGGVFGSEKPIKEVVRENQSHFLTSQIQKTMLAQVSVQNAVLTANKYVEIMNGEITIE